ncbi:MAG: hypothetical protein R3E64_02380 [Halioglobus sp.]
MIKRIPASLLLCFAVSANAIDLPWEQASPSETPQYCTGFVVGGLASRQVSGRSRTDLWLAWNYVIRSGAMEAGTLPDQYRSGAEKFQNVADSASAETILQQADGSCGLGRTGLQITGW